MKLSHFRIYIIAKTFVLFFFFKCLKQKRKVKLKTSLIQQIESVDTRINLNFELNCTILFITIEYFKLFIISTRFWSRDQRFLSDRKRSNFALRPLLSNESNRMSLSLQLKL